MSLTIEELRTELLADVEQITGRALASGWRSKARPEQLRPEGCDAFILLGGRGSGKTRSAAEDCLEVLRESPKVAHVLSPTWGDAKKTCIKGVAGSSIVECARPGEIVRFNQTDLEIELRNGSIIRGFTAEKPDRLNGPQCHHLWIDEFGLCSPEAIDQALLGWRLGEVVTFCGSSTPKPRPGTKHVLKLFPEATVRKMRMRDNEANLAANFIATVEARYGGTRLGRAEIDGEIVEDVEGALWERSWFDIEGFRLPQVLGKKDGRLIYIPKVEFQRVVVAVDPTITDPERKKNPQKEMDACGIAVVGMDEWGGPVVISDQTEVLAPADWAKKVAEVARLVNANLVIYEANQGGDLVRDQLKGVITDIPIRSVHASMAKRARAEPVALMYEQGRVRHCGNLTDLEDQMCTWDATDPSQRSPNNIDAMVWGFHALKFCNVAGRKPTSRLKRNEAAY